VLFDLGGNQRKALPVAALSEQTVIEVVDSLVQMRSLLSQCFQLRTRARKLGFESFGAVTPATTMVTAWSQMALAYPELQVSGNAA